MSSAPIADIADAPAPAVRAVLNWSLAWSDAALGQTASATEHLREMRSVMRPEAVEHRAWAYWAEGVIEDKIGNIDRAREAFRAAVRTAEGSPTPPYGVASWGSFLAQMRESLADAIADADPSQAAALYRQARDFWSDPLAWRRRQPIDAKLAAIEAL